MRQGNDVGTTYRSAIYTYSQEQLEQAQASRDQYQKVMVLFSQRAAPEVIHNPSLNVILNSYTY